MTIFHFDRLYERDIDFLIINEFCDNDAFAALFLQQVALAEATIEDVYHSLSDVSLGESDIVIIVQQQERRIALLIEDKIDANAMDEQAARYHLRGEKMVAAGTVDAYHLFIAAPQKYLETNDEAKHYPHQVSFESMLVLFAGKNDGHSQRCYQMLSDALDLQKQGYVPIEHTAVTQYWKSYYAFKKAYYPQLDLPEVAGSRGENAIWPSFKTTRKGVKVIHKSLQGCVDMELSGYAGKADLLQSLLADRLDADMQIVVTGKSASVRLSTPPIDFKQPFNQYENEMHQCFQAVERLCHLAKVIDWVSLNQCITM